jgi:hemerythrin-like domain-containing protein
MQALVTLLDDHHYIGGMLDVLEACARHLDQGAEIDQDMAAGVRQYFEQFVPTHTRKEEQVLFPRLERDLPVTDRRLLAVLRREHGIIDDLWAALAPHVTTSPSAAFSTLARAYAARKREHMHLEDGLLHRALPFADEGLSDALADVERAGLGATGREWFIQVALDYTDIVATWHPDVRHPEFGPRTAELRKRAERGLERDRGAGRR